MTRYSVHYVHKISPRDTDVGPDVVLSDEEVAASTTFSRRLREQHVLPLGGRLISYRVEETRIVVFPAASVWHSIILRKSLLTSC